MVVFVSNNNFESLVMQDIHEEGDDSSQESEFVDATQFDPEDDNGIKNSLDDQIFEKHK